MSFGEHRHCRLLPAFYLGASCVMTEAANVEQWVHALKQHPITLFSTRETFFSQHHRASRFYR